MPGSPLECRRSLALGWFRECGGMTLHSVIHVNSDRYLSFAGHEQIALWRVEKVGVRVIAQAESFAVEGVTRTAA